MTVRHSNGCHPFDEAPQSAVRIGPDRRSVGVFRCMGKRWSRRFTALSQPSDRVICAASPCDAGHRGFELHRWVPAGAKVSHLTVNFLLSRPQCRASIVPFGPGGAKGSGFVQASILDVMGARHDLRKFITELPVAERVAMLSSSREHPWPGRPGQKISQRGGMGTPEWAGAPAKTDQRPETDRRIDNVGRLTPGAGIESSTRMGSDQTAAEALQEAETEVGAAVKVDRESGVPAVPARPIRGSTSASWPES